MTVDAYILKSCDTCRKARRWAQEAGLTVTWHDVGQGPVPARILLRAIEICGSALINRQSSTWRGLPEGERAVADTAEAMADLLTAHPKLMKRPLWISPKGAVIGFKNTDAICNLA